MLRTILGSENTLMNKIWNRLNPCYDGVYILEEWGFRTQIINEYKNG